MGSSCTKPTVAPKGKKKNSKNKNTIKPIVETTKQKSTNPFDEDDDEDEVPELSSKTIIVRPISTNPFQENSSPPKYDKQFEPNPNIFSPQYFNTPAVVFRTMDECSIMYRSTDILSPRKKAIVRDHYKREEIPYRRRTMTNNEMHPPPNTNSYNFYRRFGGNFQPMFSKNNKLSASELNLSASKSNGTLFKKSVSTINIDYCPSVMFSKTMLNDAKTSENNSKGKHLKWQMEKLKGFLKIKSKKKNEHCSRNAASKE